MKTVHIPMLAVAGTAVSLAPSWALAQAATDLGWSGRGHMMWWNGGWPGMVFGPLFMILVLALVIAGAVLLIRWLAGPGPGAQPHQAPANRTALDILKERFARGEVDREEFEERRRLLGD